MAFYYHMFMRKKVGESVVVQRSPRLNHYVVQYILSVYGKVKLRGIKSYSSSRGSRDTTST